MTGLRIAVLSVHTSPLARPGGNKAGGLNVYVVELARQLVQRGCKVDIFSRLAGKHEPEVAEIEPGLRAIHLPAGPARYLAPESTVKHLPAFANAVADFAVREGIRYDLVHSHYWLSGLVGLDLHEAWGVPHVTMFHTLGEIKNRASVSMKETSLRIDSETRIIAEVDKIICATEAERTSIQVLYGARASSVAVIPLGVDLGRFQPQDKAAARAELGLEDERIVLFVGRIEPLKGIDILINAAAMLDSDVDCSVLIVGGDEATRTQVTKLQELAKLRGISHRVAFTGAVDHEKLPLYYNAADICVVPSHYESFGLVAVEAMASGLPVVASRVGGLIGTVKDGETGYLVPWLCPEPFAERIELLLDNEPLRRSLGAAAREEVARYRWENVAAGVLDVYESLIATPALATAGG
ncbi:MAG: glycosyltransferase [Dehalococcoidia bacterium]